MAKTSGYKEIAPLQRQGFAKAQMRYAIEAKKAKPSMFKGIGSDNGLSKIEASEIYWFSIMFQEGPAEAVKQFARFMPSEMLIQQDVNVNIIKAEPIPIEQWEQQHLEHEPIEAERAH